MGSGASQEKQFSSKSALFSLSANRGQTDDGVFTEIYPVWCIAVTSNGKQLASAAADAVITLWCLITYDPLVALQGHGDTVWDIKYSPDDKFLASASADGTVRLWEVETGYPYALLRGHTNWVWSLAFSPDSTRFVTAGSDCKILCWEIGHNLPVCAFQAHMKSIHAVCFSPKDFNRVVAGSADGTLSVWDLEMSSLHCRMEGHIGTVMAVDVAPGTTT